MRNMRACELKGLINLCEQTEIVRGYEPTKSLEDSGPLPGLSAKAADMRRPAALLCY